MYGGAVGCKLDISSHCIFHNLLFDNGSGIDSIQPQIAYTSNQTLLGREEALQQVQASHHGDIRLLSWPLILILHTPKRSIQTPTAG